MSLTAGVLAVQGDVSEHAAAIERAAVADGRSIEVHPIHTADQLESCDLLSIPGGESTTISRLVCREGLGPAIEAHVRAGKPTLATCAGLILLSRDPNDERVASLGCLDVTVRRNAFGRQIDSFEADLNVTGLDRPYPAVFIRAPVVEAVGEGVEVLARVDGRPVAVAEGSVVGTAFHPELTSDPRFHRLAFFDRASTPA